MKKAIAFLISFAMMICSLFSVTSCSTKDPFEDFNKRMKENKNYKMIFSLKSDNVGKITQTVYVDKNIMYYPKNTTLMTEERYVENTDDHVIEYKKSMWTNKWEKSITKQNSVWNLETNDIFNPDNFEKDRKAATVYKQKKNVIFNNFEDVTVTFQENTVVFEGVITIERVNYNMKIVISEIGEQSLTLPTVK